MIKVHAQGTVEDRLLRLEHSINYSEWIQAFPCSDSTTLCPVLTQVYFGGIVVNRPVFRTLLPDAKWLVYAGGFANSQDNGPLTMFLEYHDDTLVPRTLVTMNSTWGNWEKMWFGPIDVFGTAGVPSWEVIPIIRLCAYKWTGVPGMTASWNIWLRLIANKQ